MLGSIPSSERLLIDVIIRVARAVGDEQKTGHYGLREAQVLPSTVTSQTHPSLSLPPPALSWPFTLLSRPARAHARRFICASLATVALLKAIAPGGEGAGGIERERRRRLMTGGRTMVGKALRMPVKRGRLNDRLVLSGGRARAATAANYDRRGAQGRGGGTATTHEIQTTVHSPSLAPCGTPRRTNPSLTPSTRATRRNSPAS